MAKSFPSSVQPVFFASPDEFRAWLEANHAEAAELWVGYSKKGSGQPSITWPESVEEALCFGWIDGIRKSMDESRYVIRFTPRKPRSTWSEVNIRKALELIGLGRMRPEGLRAFEERTADNSGIYSHEQKGEVPLEEAHERLFRARPEAWEFFQAQAQGYRKAALWWIAGAKREETRRKRLETLIEDCARGRRVSALTWKSPAE